MLSFVRDNLLLVLTIMGAVLSFLASFTGLVTKRRPVLFLSVLAVLGFVVGIAYQLSAFNQKQEAARQAAADKQIAEAAQRARDGVIEAINLNVRETRVTVESIAARLNAMPLREAALRMVSIQSSGNAHFEETAAFAKGSPDLWERYADWLAGATKPGTAPCLTLTLNAGHYYDAGLLLAYLLTSNASRAALLPVVHSYTAWHDFAAEGLYLKTFAPGSRHVRWVLFYDKSPQHLIGYADAQAFSGELMVYHRLGQHEKIMQLLNHSGADPAAALKATFPSVQTAVFNTARPAELVRVMIEQQLAVAVTTAEQQPYVARLERMIQLAAGAQ